MPERLMPENTPTPWARPTKVARFHPISSGPREPGLTTAVSPKTRAVNNILIATALVSPMGKIFWIP